MDKEMTYAGTGVNYDEMDPFKRLCQSAALRTAYNLSQYGFREIPESRGESAYVVDIGPFLLAFVIEGLGTKNKVAQAMQEIMQKLTGETFHDNVAQCNFAMISNDLSTVGAAPFVAGMYLAVGISSWFNNTKRNADVAKGFQNSCDIAGCAWGGGETPTLRNIIYPDTADFAGAAIGVINPKENLLLGSRIQDGDKIILVKSSGIHANGLTLARDIAEKLPEGYLTPLPSGQTYGEALLTKTIIYAPLVNACAPLLHYAVNITGHGLRKLMRAPQRFAYIVEKPPVPPEIFLFMQKHGPVDDREAYGNLNMGAGFALYVPPENTDKVCERAFGLGYRAFVAGHIEKSDKRRVWLNVGTGIEYDEEELKVR